MLPSCKYGGRFLRPNLARPNKVVARSSNQYEEREIGSYYECKRRNVSRHFLAVSNSENLLPSCSTR